MTPEQIREEAKDAWERMEAGKRETVIDMTFLEAIIDLTYKYEDLKADYDHVGKSIK